MSGMAADPIRDPSRAESEEQKPSRKAEAFPFLACKHDISVIYYTRCEKTRMRIFLKVPKPENGRSQGKRKHTEESKTKWRKET